MGTWWGNAVGVLVALAAIGTVAVSGRRLTAAHHALQASVGPPRPVNAPLDLYELAYLRGREGRVVVTAVLRMHAEGRLRVLRRAPGRITAVQVTEPGDEVERAVLAALTRQRNADGWSPWPVELGDDRTPVREVRERLVRGGLLRDDAAPIGTLHHHPVTVAYYLARARFADTLRRVPIGAVVGVVVALTWHAWLPLLLYPPLLWAGRRHRDRHEEDSTHHGEVTESGQAAVRAAAADERGLAAAVDRQVLETAWSGPETLPAGHVLHAPPPPPRQLPPPEPPSPVTIDVPPGLGGL
ncbi:TIGR04222 domain-containing membrane protein [Streptomyces sp. NPDC051563]|uniref:TIGR04222 domain-containing membrane protein n=1 Tax=Streptomyces sp. NPDC051563 TaxID=3365659 RepID=UPI0037952747